MKKSILALFSLALCMNAFAQNDYIKPSGIGVNFSLFDFQTAANIRNTSLSETLRNKKVARVKDMKPAFGLFYVKGVSRHLDITTSLNAAFLKYPVPEKTLSADDKFYIEATAVGNLKLLPDNFSIVPYITAGVGASKFEGYYSAFIPAGLGIQFKLQPDVFVKTDIQYRIPVTSNAAYHFYYGIGIVKTFPKAKPAPVVPAPVVVLDRDGDGVLDVDDKCPDIPGLIALQGCPDRDGDGIADADDKCPDVPGLAKYQGCPIPDTDGDGINDEMDKCPTVPGLARYQGCPIPDTDGDGVNDEEDKCPTRPGPVSNQGCPVIAKEVIEKVNFAAKNVFFSTASYKLLPKSFASLKGVADLMKADNSLMLDIDGHTDSQGSDEYNHTLSDNRAASVKDYLISQGVEASRLKSTGYGETKPVADNNTAAGRAKNRRTEMTVRNF